MNTFLVRAAVSTAVALVAAAALAGNASATEPSDDPESMSWNCKENPDSCGNWAPVILGVGK
ncbi:hypothetical protein ACFXJO_40515 [Streptomyces lavendulae]|uniref:hypothetical protein n=1 Tax=Streptomyces lavendulae TaxID=1914 RepID=UPI003683E2AC